MKTISCPFCREEIRADAVLCKHCHSRLQRTRTDMAIAAVMERGRIAVGPPPAIFRPSGGACEAWCYYRHGNDKGALQQCLDDCKAEKAMELLLENLHRELDQTFIDVIWSGGDIDPKPLEEAVRERFASNRPDNYP